MHADAVDLYPRFVACNIPTRGGHGRTCQLPQGHRGTHSAHVFHCDGCGLVHRGAPHVTAPDGAWDEPHGLGFCFLCARELRRGVR